MRKTDSGWSALSYGYVVSGIFKLQRPAQVSLDGDFASEPVPKFLFHYCLLLDCGGEAIDIIKICHSFKCLCLLKPLDLCIPLLMGLLRKKFHKLHLCHPLL